MISNVSNAVKLLSKIDNKDSYMKLYTNVNSNFVVGDRVYILSYNSGDTNADLDNYLYYVSRSGTNIGDITCEQYLQGYLVKEIDVNNNSIVINRMYSTLPSVSGITSDNFFISKTLMLDSVITGGELNGVVLKTTAINNTLGNVKWVQGIVLGGNINNLVLSDKYTNMTLSLNSFINNGEISSYYTYNNDTYGYSVFSGKTSSLSITLSTIFNGYFYNSVLNGYVSSTPVNYPIIYNGYYELCDFNNNFIFNNGYYKKSKINSVTSIWNYGTFDPVNIATYVFNPIIWTNGVWMSSDTPPALTWEYGVFNGNTFSASCIWKDGIFNGDNFLGSWSGGTFNSGLFNTAQWASGIFNNGIFAPTRVWLGGTFNNGTFYGTWQNGVFNNGTFGTGATWITGTFNNGKFASGSTWLMGTFNNGLFEGSTWTSGNWYDGVMSNSQWASGNFYKGEIKSNTQWYTGIFHFGKFDSSKWYTGTWYNGIMTNSNFIEGVWWDGEFTNGEIGLNGGSSNINWYNGNFNTGIFREDSIWHNGSFHNGVFDGNWISGIFYQGQFNLINTTNIPTVLGKPFEPYQKQKFVRNLGKPLNIKMRIK